jgi:hypothetical protein
MPKPKLENAIIFRVTNRRTMILTQRQPKTLYHKQASSSAAAEAEASAASSA